MNGTVSVPAGAGPCLRLRVPADPRYGRYVRERVVGFAAGHGIPDEDAYEFVTALSEALANAIEHSSSRDTIEIACWITDREELFATVIDHGIGFNAAERAEPKLPDVYSERGRGLPIMQRFTDVLNVRSTPGKGTSVLLGRFLRRHDPTAIAG
jgi:stage II sporulation protein AB (anti-sigma F factor)